MTYIIPIYFGVHHMSTLSLSFISKQPTNYAENLPKNKQQRNINARKKRAILRITRVAQRNAIKLDTIIPTQTKLRARVNSRKISESEYQRRLTAWEKTVANFALENITPSAEMQRIALRYINGEITLEQQSQMMRQAILAG